MVRERELPIGTRFAPTDEELLQLLSARIGLPLVRTLPPVEGSIQTIEEEEGLGYTNPENLPGANKDGSKIYFFHKWMNDDRVSNSGEQEMVWRKYKPTMRIFEWNGAHLGFKTIMVFDEIGENDGSRWVAHQYHLIENPNEDDNHFVVSKVFYKKSNRRIIDELMMQHLLNPPTDEDGATLDDVEFGMTILQIGVEETLNEEMARANRAFMYGDGPEIPNDEDDDEGLNNIPLGTGSIDTPPGHQNNNAAMDNL